MNDKARLFETGRQPPVIQLLTSVFIVILAGTLIFYLFVFAGAVIFGKGISEMLSLPSADAGSVEICILKFLQASQQIALFAIPALVIAVLFRKDNESFMRTDKVPGSIPVILVILLAILLIPVANYIGNINSKMDLPDWLSGVEAGMRAQEDKAAGLINLLIKSSGAGELIINILILAIIPSIAEEMIFRGIFQQLICRLFRSAHFGIWITAIIFSAIHLQFFGFLPRLILGLSFGYLFYWSGNLWIAVIAHFINNAVPVVLSYYTGWTELNEKTSELAQNQILLPVFTAFLSGCLFYYFWSEHRKNLSV
jgi:membrane protease YdiL (CAAX protease family)